MQARAHEQGGTLLPRERHAHAYEEALKARYKHLPEVRRILRHRHLPSDIYKARAPTPPSHACTACSAHERRRSVLSAMPVVVGMPPLSPGWLQGHLHRSLIAAMDRSAWWC